MRKYKERKAVALIGIRFGRLLVIADLGLRPRNNGANNRWWLCQCDCDNTTETTTRCLRYGDTKSCGCYGAERRREASIAALTKHGHARANGQRSPEYNVFKTMHARCYNPKNHKYPDYGGDGIIVELRWHDFPAFFADMGQRPTPAHQIERRNNDGNYGPDNCYWATPQQQARNRRSNRLITINNETHCVAEWAEISGTVSQHTLLYRLNAGWPISQLLTPTQKGNTNAICK